MSTEGLDFNSLGIVFHKCTTLEEKLYREGGIYDQEHEVFKRCEAPKEAANSLATYDYQKLYKCAST